MSDERFERVRSILAKALELPESERAEYVSTACGSDADLEAEVHRILAADPERVGALRTGALEEWIQRVDSAPASHTGGDLPASVGPYRVVRALGEGGMGTVYLAEQERPLRRRVALKLIKLGMDSGEVIARFEQERQALALMDHPHIAKVFDAGTADSGRPYFVMEFVPGIPITQYSDRERLPTEARLRLFVPVCLALHHAHQKGIIHRDVKPSNVLISEEEGRPVPKVIDFGVAKATSQRLTERSLHTRLGHFVGTPEYMSPEQMDSTGLDVDTTSDVYSLGVLLYELLTGSLPFERDHLQRGGWEAMARRLREEEPLRPSARVAGLGESGSGVAGRRGTSVSGLRRRLRGDLDWIVSKAMAKERGERYASASELAADVERSLRNETVVAGPPSVLYRVRKLVRRRRTELVATGVVLAGLTVALVESNRLRLQAEQSRDESAAVTRFLTGMLSAADPRESGRDTPIGKILDDASGAIESGLDDQPTVESQLRVAIGSAYQALGEFDASHTHLDRAIEIARAELGPEHRQTLAAMDKLGTLRLREGHYLEAESLHVHVLGVQRRTLGARHRETLASMTNLATVWLGMGRREEAAALYHEALEGQLRVIGEVDRTTLGSMHNLALLYREIGQYDRSESLHTRVLDNQRRLLPPDHPEYLITLNSLAVLYSVTQRFAEAESLLVETVRIRRRVLGDEHPETLTALNNRASLYSQQERHAEAAELHRAILETRRRTLGDVHPHTLISMGNLGDAYTMSGDAMRGEPLLADAVRLAARALGSEHAIHSVTLRKHGVCLGRLGRFTEAETALLRSHGLLQETFGPAHARTLLARADLADLYRAWGKTEQESHWREESFSPSEG